MVHQQGIARPLRELALFAGAGGGILGGRLLGWECICAVELNEYARNVLIARQNDGTFAPFPVWDDVRTFDGRPWRGLVDVVSGGFPCTDLSRVKQGAEWLDGDASGLWREHIRIIREVLPAYALIENASTLVDRGLDRILCDLAASGYDAKWCVMGASDIGAPHDRQRCWILATSADAARAGLQGRPATGLSQRPAPVRHIGAGDWWKTEPDVQRVAYGVAAQSYRLAAIGNGQVPAMVAAAWGALQ